MPPFSRFTHSQLKPANFGSGLYGRRQPELRQELMQEPLLMRATVELLLLESSMLPPSRHAGYRQPAAIRGATHLAENFIPFSSEKRVHSFQRAKIMFISPTVRNHGDCRPDDARSLSVCI